MKTIIKLAALGAVALAASSSATLAGSELPSGALTGLALGAPLPEGIYDLSIASYGSAGAAISPMRLLCGSCGRLPGKSPAAAWALAPILVLRTLWAGSTPIADSFLNTLVEGHLGWSLHNGFNVSVYAGAWLPSTQTIPMAVGRDYTAFQGLTAVSYIANGWNLTATGGYGSGGGGVAQAASNSTSQSASYTLDLTASRKYGKMELGSIAYGSWDVDGAKEEHFALGGLVGYDFGGFVAQAKLGTDVERSAIAGQRGRVDEAKETRGWLTIIKPLWNPAAEGALK